MPSHLLCLQILLWSWGWSCSFSFRLESTRNSIYSFSHTPTCCWLRHTTLNQNHEKQGKLAAQDCMETQEDSSPPLDCFIFVSSCGTPSSLPVLTLPMMKQALTSLHLSFGSCPSMLCVAVIKPWPKPSEGRKGLSWRLGRNLEARTEAETMQEHGLLCCLLWLAQLPLFHS